MKLFGKTLMVAMMVLGVSASAFATGETTECRSVNTETQVKANANAGPAVDVHNNGSNAESAGSSTQKKQGE